MLVQSSLPTSIGDHGKQECSCVWIPNDESWQKPTTAVPVIVHNNKNDSLWSPNLLSSSQLSTEVNISETSTLNFVYRRRMIHKNTNRHDVLTPNQSSTPTLVYKRRKIQSENSKSGSVDGGSLGDELIEDPKRKLQNCMTSHAVNDSCSSSKSNLDPGTVFLKHQVDDVGECSSSGVVITEGTNSCISFLKQHGVLERLISKKKASCVKRNTCLRACKVCDQLTTTLKMLICDLCEESFHMSCCNPVIKKVPVGDWFCHSCSRKKLKKMETNSRRSSKDCLGPIASMLRDVHPYTSDVRIGEDFQAEVPDWFGPLTDDLNDYIEPKEMSPSESANYQELNPGKLLRLSSIGNWLQCREVVDGVGGTICGKWRRAPLFEVQTDDWECFCSVLWDPTHADCAVPQELDTDQVLKQLKYIEMLRPRLSTKRWKLGVNKGVDQQERKASEDPRKTQKS